MPISIIFDGIYLEVTSDPIPEDTCIVGRVKTLVDGTTSCQYASTIALETNFSGVGSRNQIQQLRDRIGLKRTLSIGGKSYTNAYIRSFDWNRDGELWEYTVAFGQKTSAYSG
jgi:hypothetical protein